jgi:alanine racemase
LFFDGGSLRPTFAEIDLEAIAQNIRAIKTRVHPAQVMAVVKADGYGHGAAAVARAALENGATYLGVALAEEGIALRRQGFLEPILVFGGVFEEQLLDVLKYKLEVTVYADQLARALSKIAASFQQTARIHVKVDTGMGRVGVEWENAVKFIKQIKKLDGIDLHGLYTHFATSDERDKAYANLQFARFKEIIQQLENEQIQIPLKHAANSGAILDLPETYLDMVRPGVMMYGYYPSTETTESIPITPAMTLKSRVSYIKQVPENTSISYGRKYITSKPTKIATIPLGYADGYNRLLTNRAQVTIRGKKFPLVGRVCMDLILVDIGLNNEIQVGDEVILFGKPEANAMTIYDICKLIETIPYEVTCWISSRVPRVYIK